MMYTLWAILSVVRLTSAAWWGQCDQCDWFGWKEWSSCSQTCGGGTRSRTRSLCCDTDWSWDECVSRCGLSSSEAHDYGSCNNFCYNGGTMHYSSSYYDNSCICPAIYFGTCCKQAICHAFAYLYKFALVDSTVNNKDTTKIKRGIGPRNFCSLSNERARLGDIMWPGHRTDQHQHLSRSKGEQTSVHKL